MLMPAYQIGSPSLSPDRPLPPRDTRGPTPLSQCGPIADLTARARELDSMSSQIVALLPPPLREHTGFAGLRNDRVLLLVESPAWATRVRMEQTRILAAVHSLGLAATSVTVKVAPFRASDVDIATSRQVSPHTAQRIRAAAAAIADPDLKAVFLDLATLAEIPSTD
jgi:hypothetical protein